MRVWSALMMSSLAATLIAGCEAHDAGEPAPSAPAWTWALPPGVPAPRVPSDNPMSQAKVELGRRLFYDVRLSGNQTQSCASCHKQALAFTDGLAKAVGSTGQAHFRSAMSLVNVAYASSLGWSGLSTPTLESQAPIPMFGEDPVELGLGALELEVVLERLRQDPDYPTMFAQAFALAPEAADEPARAVTLDHVIKAIASFQRALVSFESPFDRYILWGERDALTPAARRGMELFFSERLECFHCHGGFTLSDAVSHDGLTLGGGMAFHNTGLYNLDGQGAYPDEDRGLFDLTGKPHDMGRFKAPPLRNIAKTAPYFHDGSAATLDEVLDHYARGGRAIVRPPYQGDGRKNPFKSELIQGFVLSQSEREDLLAFLHSLTDEAVLRDPRWSDPFASRGAL